MWVFCGDGDVGLKCGDDGWGRRWVGVGVFMGEGDVKRSQRLGVRRGGLGES